MFNFVPMISEELNAIEFYEPCLYVSVHALQTWEFFHIHANFYNSYNEKQKACVDLVKILVNHVLGNKFGKNFCANMYVWFMTVHDQI